MFESFFSMFTTDATLTIPDLLVALGVSLVLGLVISLVYMKTNKAHTPTQSFTLTLVILPVIITVIILLVGNNVARAFSLAGAFSIIRFRSAPGDPKEITYVLLCMAVGLAIGMGFILFGVIVAIILCLVMILLETFKFGYPKATGKLLKITVPENLDFENVFDSILQKYTFSYTLQKIKTADLGSLYELQYLVTTKSNISEKDFIDELRCRNGNLNITLVLDVTKGEF